MRAEKKQAELEGRIASLTGDVSAAKAAAEAELKRAHAVADAKIQTYNERTSEVGPGRSGYCGNDTSLGQRWVLASIASEMRGGRGVMGSTDDSHNAVQMLKKTREKAEQAANELKKKVAISAPLSS